MTIEQAKKQLPIGIQTFGKIRERVFQVGLIFNTHARNLVQMEWI